MAFIYRPVVPAPNVRHSTHLTANLTSRTPRTTPTCSTGVPRRSVLKLLGLAVAVGALPSDTRAFSLKDVEKRKTVDLVKLGRLKATDLKKKVQEWGTCTDDERLLVLRFVPIWLEPARKASAKLATLFDGQPNTTNIEQLTTQSNALFGHLLELNQEANAKSKEGIIRELDEFVETADVILAIAKSNESV